MRFTKMHGIGNNYIYVDGLTQQLGEPNWNHLAARVSDRNFGIGSDGLILILPSESADFRMRMFNADGSEGRMCGNGIRCVGKYVYDKGLTRKTSLAIETLAGVRHLELGVTAGSVRRVRVDMGEPGLLRKDVPFVVGDPNTQAVDEPLQVGDRTYRLTAVSIGNPHCVIFVDDVDDFPVTEVGPQIERHPAFPDRVNVEFIQVLSPSEIRMRVWERGSGETQACGTGACAVAVAASLNGVSNRNVTVHLLGGPLEIDWAGDGRVYMTGDANEVCTGQLSPEWLG